MTVELSDAKTMAALDSAELEQMVDTNPELESMPERLEAGSVVAGRYRIIRHLGAGGMGNVYLAEHTAIGKEVAIKTLNLDLAKRRILRERFLREARSASQIRHANVVDITDFGRTDEGAPFIAMEYLDGEDLKQTLQREGRLSFARAREIVIQICHALEAAHAKGIVHRDVKPANCFRIEQPGNPDTIKVVDFGIAKATATTAPDATELTKTGVIVGTAAYMSPEQARGDSDIDARADVYSVGIILFRMLSGRLPYDSSSPLGMITKHLTDPIPSLLEIEDPPPVSSTVDDIVRRALAKRREDRFQSAAELAAALTDAEVVHAARSSRRSLWMGAAGLAGLLVIGGVGMALMGSERQTPDPPAKPAATAPTKKAEDTAPAAEAGEEPAPTTVLVTLTGAPEDARVRIEGKDYGLASAPLRLDRGESSVTLEVVAEGYLSSSIVVVPLADVEVPVSLVAAAVPAAETEPDPDPEPTKNPKNSKKTTKKTTKKPKGPVKDDKGEVDKDLGF